MRVGRTFGGYDRDSLRGFTDVVSIQKKGNAVSTAPTVSAVPIITTFLRRPIGLLIAASPESKLQRRDHGDDREQHYGSCRSESERVELEALLVDVKRDRRRRVYRAA